MLRDFDYEKLAVRVVDDMTGAEYGLYSDNGMIEIRYLTMLGVWSIVRSCPARIFEKLITEYAKLKVKEIADGKDTGCDQSPLEPIQKLKVVD